MPGAAQTTPSGPAYDPRCRQLSSDEVQKLVNAGKTLRSIELEGYQAFFDGTAYDGRPHFYSGDVPLQQRKPIVVYPVVRLAAESNVAFAMGEGRFPLVLSLSSEGDDVFDQALGLSKSDSSTLDSFNAKLLDLGRLPQAFRNAYRMAMASRSVALILGFRQGMPFVDPVWSKLCTPTFGDPNDPQRCTKLEVRYRYTDSFRDRARTGGKWWPVVYEYLRIINDTADTVYSPVAIWDETDPGAVEGGSATQSTTIHGFNFCPVHWYARNRDGFVGGAIDGKAIHDGMCGLIEQLDFSLSQRHRAAIYAGDPQTVLSGITGDDDLGGGGGSRLRPVELPGDKTQQGKGWQRGFNQAQQGPVTKRGVMNPWLLSDPAARAALLTLPGDALKALDDDAKDLANRIADGLGVVIIDPATITGGGDLSGRTLAFIFSKQVNRVSLDREDLGRCCILPVLNLFYRMVITSPTGVYLPGLAKVLPILARFSRSVSGQPAPIWFAPQLKLKWGDFFEPSDVDEATRVQTAIAALTASPAIITKASAVEHIRSVFAIGSVDQYVATLETEAAARQAAAVQNAQAVMSGISVGGDDPTTQQSPAAAPPAKTPKPKRGVRK